MDGELGRETGIIAGEQNDSLEAMVLGKERWDEVRRLQAQERLSVSEISRRLEIDRKTVRKALRSEWKGYARVERNATLLAEHDAFLRTRAAEVNYSARILYQELVHMRGFAGSYQTVKRFVAPLRANAEIGSLCQIRFETAPGQQSQIDWGQVRTYLRQQAVQLHVFVLTLGYSRRSYYRVCANEQMGLFLEAHEAAFEHFGGLTREHSMTGRARCVSQRMASGAGTRPSVRSRGTGDSNRGYVRRIARKRKGRWNLASSTSSATSCRVGALSTSLTFRRSSMNGPLASPTCAFMAPPMRVRSIASTPSAKRYCRSPGMARSQTTGASPGWWPGIIW
jgi:transposase